MKKRLFYFGLMLFFTIQICAQVHNVENFKGRTTLSLNHGSDHPGKRTDELMERWRDYGLGQFIHWGVYSVLGGQWNGKVYTGAAEWIRAWDELPNSEYDNLYKHFNPTEFNAKEWASLAKKMGAGYVIFTTKHHDGFCMWPSKYTNYDIESTPYKKDIVRQIVDAYTAEGIDVYLYYSVMDWNQGGWFYTVPTAQVEKNKWEEFKQFTRHQLLELLEMYPEIKGLWFDGTWDDSWVHEAEFAHKLEKELRLKHPGLIIGSRFRADEFGNRQYDKNGDLIGDYDQTWERDIPLSIEQLHGNDWDCCMTIPENGWGYTKEWKTYTKTPYELINMISECNSMGGNLVINFGPDSEGNIRSEEVDIALEIGEWMSINGEAIRNTGPAYCVRKQGWGVMTQKDNQLYLHVYNKPLNNILRIEFDRKTYVPGNTIMLKDKTHLKIEDAGRNKKNNRLFNVYLPVDWNYSNPFVIKMELIDNTEESDAYQQAKI